MEVVVVWIVECSRSRKCFTFGLYASLMADRSLRFIQGCARRVCLFGWRLHFFRQSLGMFMSTCILGLLNLSYMLIMQERHGIGATHDSRKDAGRRFSVAHLNSLLPCDTQIFDVPHNMQLELAHAITRPHGGHECSFLRQYITS